MNKFKVSISFLFVVVAVLIAIFAGGQPRFGALSARAWMLLGLEVAGTLALVMVAGRIRRSDSSRSTALPNVSDPSQPDFDALVVGTAETLGRPSYPHPVINVQTCIGCHACVEACPHDVLAMVNGKAAAISIEQCMEDASCQVECPTVPKSCIVINATKRVPERKVPSRNAQYLTNVPGIYLIGDVSGVPLIKNAINEGGRVIDFVAQDLRSARTDDSVEFDVAIIGMGPAGLSAALIAHQRGLRSLAIEQDEILATIQHAYQAGKYIYFNPVDQPAQGGIELEGPGALKEDIVSKWMSTVSSSGLRVRQSERCVDLRRSVDCLVVSTERERDRTRSDYKCARVILAIGNRGMPMKLGVPGEDLRAAASNAETSEENKVKYRLIDPAAYQGKHVVVVGAGNSAIEAAIDLAAIRAPDGGGISAWRDNVVSLVIRSDLKGDLKLANKMMVYDCIDSGRIKAYFGKTIKEIKSDLITLSKPRDPTTETDTIRCDYVFCLIGGEKPTKFLESIGVTVG